jgi:hypothetical protein
LPSAYGAEVLKTAKIEDTGTSQLVPAPPGKMDAGARGDEVHDPDEFAMSQSLRVDVLY